LYENKKRLVIKILTDILDFLDQNDLKVKHA